MKLAKRFGVLLLLACGLFVVRGAEASGRQDCLDGCDGTLQSCLTSAESSYGSCLATSTANYDSCVDDADMRRQGCYNDASDTVNYCYDNCYNSYMPGNLGGYLACNEDCDYLYRLDTGNCDRDFGYEEIQCRWNDGHFACDDSYNSDVGSCDSTHSICTNACYRDFPD